MATEVEGGAAAQTTTETKGPSWDRVLVNAGAKSIPADGRRVIVAEAMVEADKSGVRASKTSGYPKDADLYLRVNPELDFGVDAEVITLGVEARAKGVGGFAVRGLAVGNGHPAYPAANLAWQRGAKDIVIAGLTKADQEALAPFFTLKMPAGVKIAFA